MPHTIHIDKKNAVIICRENYKEGNESTPENYILETLLYALALAFRANLLYHCFYRKKSKERKQTKLTLVAQIRMTRRTYLVDKVISRPSQHALITSDN